MQAKDNAVPALGPKAQIPGSKMSCQGIRASGAASLTETTTSLHEAGASLLEASV